MKLSHSQSCTKQGNAIVVVILMAFVGGAGLAAVLGLTVHEQRILARTSAWNSALPVADAGIEEAMSHLQQVGTGPRGVNGWQASGSSFTLNRQLDNGRYVVGISTATRPVVISRGEVWCPSAGRYISRTIQITTTNIAQFTFALAARYLIDINGNGISTDSFDSSNPNLSTNGWYTPSKTSTNGDVASTYGVVELGNHSLKGDLYLGATATYTGNSNQVSGTIAHDFNLDFPSVVPPDDFTSWVRPPAANLNVGGKVYKYAFLLDGDYTIPDSANIYVAPNAKVRLRVTAANFSPAAILVAGTNNLAGKLTIYMAGDRATLGSSTVESGKAANFSYLGLSTNTRLTSGGSSTFIGTIYAPDANLILNGGGNSTGLIGSCVAKNVQINGHYNFHYDESLAKLGPPRGLFITSWTEL